MKLVVAERASFPIHNLGFFLSNRLSFVAVTCVSRLRESYNKRDGPVLCAGL